MSGFRRHTTTSVALAILLGLTAPLAATPAWAASESTTSPGGSKDSPAVQATPSPEPTAAPSPEPTAPGGLEPGAALPPASETPSPETPAPADPPTTAPSRTDAPDAGAPGAADGPASTPTAAPVSGVTFDWGINNESSGGSYFGVCNFLSAGVAGDTGRSRVWSQTDGFFKSSEGNTTIVKPTANDGTGEQEPTWATKCLLPDGGKLVQPTSNNPLSYTRSRVQIAGGTGTVDPAAETAEIQWKGSFTVAYYGGMTYWSVTDPTLTVQNGKGTVTALVTGYGADMDNPEVWRKLTDRPNLTIAELSNVDVTAAGFTVTPDYLGVAVPADVAGRNAQAVKTETNTPYWGAFPADFLRFQVETGQSSYWYTSDGGPNTIQPRKATTPLKVTTGGTGPIAAAPVIRTQPQDVSAAAGTTAAFVVEATGSPAPTYQWQRLDRSGTWVDVAGGMAAKLDIPVSKDVDGTKYRVIVTNRVGSATSAEAVLTVTAGSGGPGVPGTPAAPVETSGALFDWGINNESNGGAYFGGCNFLSAGVTGDAGSSRLWSAGDGLYRSQEGNTTVVRPTADGGGISQVSWDTKCQTPTGTSVNGKTTNAGDSFTQTRVRIAGGAGTLDPATNTAEIAWSGSFTVAYYGGMAYWSASNPRLVVNADGTGTVTVTASGYGSDMDDASIWRRLAPRDVVIANLSGVKVTEKGITVTPDYLGVSVPGDVSGRNPQAKRTAQNEAWWGAFPADFLRFQVETGQSSYWWTTDGTPNSIQPRKVPLPLTVCPTSDCTVAPQGSTTGPASIDLRQNARKPPLAFPRPAVQAPPVAAAAGEETVVMVRKAGSSELTSTGRGVDADRMVIAATSLIIALGLLALVAAGGGGLFATGAIGGGAFGSGPPRKT